VDGPTFPEQPGACIMPTSPKAQKRSCPHCGALYEVHRSMQNGARKYRTAVCTHCGDVMAEWEGRIRHYRRIGRPKSSTQATKLVDQAAAAATQLKRRKRTGVDAKPSRALTRRKVAKPQPQDEKMKTESERAQDKIMTPEKQGGIAGP
jgi:hypothetical protein